MSDVAGQGLTSSEGTSAPGTTDLGATSTESVGADQAASGSTEAPALYSVKVGGREEQVTFDELTNGYMRQADYTRKTQELSGERTKLANVQQLADALERDPRGTIVALAGVLGVDIGTAANVAAAAVAEDDDPIAQMGQKVDRLTQQLTAREQADQQARDAAARQANAQAQIEREMQNLRDQHGAFPEQEFLQWTADISRASGQVVPLEVAYRAWQFDAAEAKRLAELNAATEAKRRAQVVGGGHSTAASATQPGAAAERGIAAAFRAAMREHSE